MIVLIDGVKTKTKIWVQPKLKDYVWKYTGGSYKKYNKVLRQNAEEGEETDLDGALILKEGLKKCTINRNIVVRREVRGLDTLANMLGLKIDPKQKDYADKLKDAIKGKVGEQKDKDVVLTDPRVCQHHIFAREHFPFFGGWCRIFHKCQKGNPGYEYLRLQPIPR